MKAFLAYLVSTLFFLSPVNIASGQSTKSTSNSGIENLKWLLGTWENKSSQGTIYETWIQISPSEFSGKSYMLNGADTIVFETLKLIEKNGVIQYIPVVRDQNDGKPVVFNASYFSRSKLVVEAPEHDFPTAISYTLIAQDQLVAEISGPSKDGKLKYQTFPMKRIPDQTSQNIALVENVFRYINEHNWTAMASLYADPASFKDPAFGLEAVPQTRAENVKKFEELNKMAPDIKVEIVSVYPSEGNQVTVEFISSGTAEDGSIWKMAIVTIFTIENNLIVKDFTYYDQP